MRKVTIVFHDAGGGHRNAAEALKTVLEEQDYPWQVKLLNLQELLAPIDFAAKATGLRFQDGYNLLLRKGWTRITPQLLVLLRYTIRLHHGRIVRLLQKHWSEHSTHLVLSVIRSGLRHAAHRPGRLSPRLLDGAGVRVHRLRKRARQTAGALDGASAQAHFRDFRNGAEAVVLSETGN
jgi:1,2-diacylglycerol 3-beta-galactosyltransferase